MPHIVTFEDIESSNVPDPFQHLVVARTVCHWSDADIIAVTRIAEPSHQYVHLRRNTVISGQIIPISEAPNKTRSSADQTINSSKTIKSTRHEQRVALTNAFGKTTFSPGECEKILVLELCTQYRSVFSLSPRDLGK